jgi:hypothetical protein
MMKDFPIRNIFLPATFVGVATFSLMAFSLPSLIERYSPDRGPSTGIGATAKLTGIHKELVITYIGSAIVISTSAGLGTAELLRKRSAQKAKTSGLKSMLAEWVDHDAQQQPTEIDAYFAAMLAEQSGENDDWQESPTVTEPQTMTAHIPDLDQAFSEAASDTPWAEPEQLGPLESAPINSSAPAPDEDTVMIFPGQYQRCRIQIPDFPEQQYAIEFHQKFYRLLGSGVSKDQALMAVKQLCQEQQPAILTQMDQGYAVWVLAPHAQLIAVA